MKTSDKLGVFGVMWTLAFFMTLMDQLIHSWTIVIICAVGAVWFFGGSWFRYRKGD